MLALNFKSVGDKRSHKVAFSLAFAILPALVFFVDQILEQRWYRILIFFISGLMMYIAEEWQGAIYKQHIEGGGEKKSVVKVVGSILVSVLIIFLFTIFSLMLKELWNL